MDTPLINQDVSVTPVYRTIEEFEEKKNNERIILEPFYTCRHGYKMRLAVYPNDVVFGKNLTYLSSFI